MVLRKFIYYSSNIIRSRICNLINATNLGRVYKMQSQRAQSTSRACPSLSKAFFKLTFEVAVDGIREASATDMIRRVHQMLSTRSLLGRLLAGELPNM